VSRVAVNVTSEYGACGFSMCHFVLHICVQKSSLILLFTTVARFLNSAVGFPAPPPPLAKMSFHSRILEVISKVETASVV
jgi:hypothetical protein